MLDDEDEVLLELVESLSNNFVEFVGGNSLVLMPTFEALCKVEDSNVRDKVKFNKISTNRQQHKSKKDYRL